MKKPSIRYEVTEYERIKWTKRLPEGLGEFKKKEVTPVARATVSRITTTGRWLWKKETREYITVLWNGMSSDSYRRVWWDDDGWLDSEVPYDLTKLLANILYEHVEKIQRDEIERRWRKGPAIPEARLLEGME